MEALNYLNNQIYLILSILFTCYTRLSLSRNPQLTEPPPKMVSKHAHSSNSPSKIKQDQEIHEKKDLWSIKTSLSWLMSR